jgi:pimeloyl-ACP methyl ester carboxylesterase
LDCIYHEVYLPFRLAFQANTLCEIVINIPLFYPLFLRHWRNNIKPLAARGWRVYSLDLLGFGLGDMPAPGSLDCEGGIVAYDFDYWTAQLRAFCTSIVGAAGPVFLVANSIGSMVTMQASIEDPTLCSAHVFISPSLRQLNVRKRSWFQSVSAPIAMWVLSYRPIGAYFLKSLSRPDQLRRVLKKAYAIGDRVDDELIGILREPALSPGALDVFLAFVRHVGYSIGFLVCSFS